MLRVPDEVEAARRVFVIKPVPGVAFSSGLKQAFLFVKADGVNADLGDPGDLANGEHGALPAWGFRPGM